MATAIHLRASNGQYVCAEGGGGRELVANRTLPQAWETFVLADPDGPPLTTGEPVVFVADNGMYVCAEGGGGGAVDATRTLASTWETFRVVKPNGQNGGVSNGDRVAVQASNGMYVCAEGGGGGAVNANRTAIGPWETFTLEILGPTPLRAHQGPDSVGSGEFMESNVILSSPGRVDSENHTWTTNRFFGFTGGTGVFFIDLAQNVIANLPFRAQGVDGTWIPGLPSSYTATNVDDIGMDVFNRTVKIVIVHRLSPRNRLMDDINAGYYVAKKISEVFNDFARNGRP